jgi:nitrate/nitrite transport system ATP-binding protein
MNGGAHIPLLSLRGVGKSYDTRRGSRRVLHDLDLDVDEGELVAIVGASGSGKTTLVSLIAGLLLPDEGEILFGGRPVREPGPERGIVFQNYSLLSWMSVLDNVRLAVDAVSTLTSGVARRERAEELVRLVGLEAAMHKRPHQLSGGMRQRVAVARGLAMEPRLLLLDEPFSALDALTRTGLQDELARIWVQRRTTMILITNDVEEAVLLADRIHPLTPGPGAHLGAEIAVDIERPRNRRRMNNDTAYHAARRQVIDFLAHQRRAPAAVAPDTREALSA